jgi:peptidoglycan/xylan/chitin deacetylase (PgdA/CDA1 family)
MGTRRYRVRAILIAVVLAAAGGLGLLFFPPGRHRGAPVPAPVPARPSTGILRRVETRQKVVALTFDFDMTPGMLQRLRSGQVRAWYDPAVFEILRRERVPHTIFLTGLAAVAYPRLARAFARDPLVEIGDHSYRHFAFAPDCFGLPALDQAGARADVERAQQAIRAVTGVTPRYFRFPGGCTGPGSAAMVAGLGLRVVHWDVASGDAFNPVTAAIVAHVEAHARPGSIILFHVGGPNAPRTAEALRAVIPYLRAEGYRFATVTGLLELQACGGTAAGAGRPSPSPAAPGRPGPPCPGR